MAIVFGKYRVPSRGYSVFGSAVGEHDADRPTLLLFDEGIVGVGEAEHKSAGGDRLRDVLVACQYGHAVRLQVGIVGLGPLDS